MKLENLDIYIPNTMLDSKCSEVQFNATKLSCWLDAKGITANLWELVEGNTELITTGASKVVFSPTGFKIGAEDIVNGGIQYLAGALSLVANKRINIVSDEIKISHLGSPICFEIFENNLYLYALPDYVDTATAAADASLESDVVFKVTNGDGTARLHIKE